MSLSIQPIGPALGAVVHGVDLSQELDNATFDGLYDAFNKYSVLLLPDQHLSPQQHVAFSARFGELEEHVLREDLLDGQPEIYILTNKTKNGKRLGRPKAGWYWHTDLSYQANPSKASFMHALEVPTIGGDTMFASTAAAYDALSDPMKQMLAGLTAEHHFRHAFENFAKHYGAAPISEETFAARPPVVHPMTRTHPETGRKAIYVNEGFTSRVMELEREESVALLGFLYRHCTRPEFVYRHKWNTNDFVMWDNRVTMHCALGNYNEDRYMHRTTISGDVIE